MHNYQLAETELRAAKFLVGTLKLKLEVAMVEKTVIFLSYIKDLAYFARRIFITNK